MNLANKLTIGRVVAVPFFVIAYIANQSLAAFIIFILASVTDMFDGMIARKYNMVTSFGKIMDPLADKVLVYAAFCLMIEKGIIPGWTLIIILAREFAIAGMRAVAASEGMVIAAGITGKIKTVLQMIAVPLLLLVNTEIFPSNVSNYTYWGAYIFFWSSLFMTVYSGIEYIWQNRKVFST